MSSSSSLLPTSIIRKTSPATGLSYLQSGSFNTITTTATTHGRLYIFVHGWACAASDYALLLAALAESQPASVYIAIDLPNHGASPQSACPEPTVSAFAKLINDVRREVSETRRETSPETVPEMETVLVGHSMGCRMALEAYAQAPAHVCAIVLLDGSWVGRTAEVHTPPDLAQLEREHRRVLERIGMFGPRTPEAFVEEVGRRLRGLDLGYEYALSRDYIGWDVGRMEAVLEGIGRAEEGRLLGVLVLQATMGRGLARRDLRGGEEGPWMPFVREKVGGKFEGFVIEGCGHWPHVDKPEEVVKLIRRFEGDRLRR